MIQKIISTDNGYGEIDRVLSALSVRKILLVCGSSAGRTEIGRYFEHLDSRLGIEVIRFTGFGPNPQYESVAAGADMLRQQNCGMVVAVGGGSAMDVAKCIRLSAGLDAEGGCLEQGLNPNDIKLMVVPTTAGTGSEATRYAVIYHKGEKQSVTHDRCIPELVVMDPASLRTLPDYHRKASMLDALCHGIEACWSVNSNGESRAYSRKAVEIILNSKDRYLANTDEGNREMLYAAHLAGKAINITQTTAGHAMCYKLTGLYGIAHGHAAALCVSVLWPYMATHTNKCADPRGQKYLEKVFRELAGMLGCKTVLEAADTFRSLLWELKLGTPEPRSSLDYRILTDSVNPERMKNNPVTLDKETLNTLYHLMLEDGHIRDVTVQDLD